MDRPVMFSKSVFTQSDRHSSAVHKHTRRRKALVLAIVLAGQFVNPAPAAGWSSGCIRDGFHGEYAGMGVYPTGLQGVQAKIEWFNTSLCLQGPNPDYSWSLSWVGLVGRTYVFDIFQGGFAKCASVGGGWTCPYNNGVSYYWYEWGYGPGNCGDLGFSSGFTKALKGNAPQGNDPYGNVYKIEHVSSTNRFVFSIDGVDQKHLNDFYPLTCWGGVTGTQIMNEMLDNGDQNAGTVSNEQSYSAVMYQNGSGGWQNISWTLGRPCDANSYPTAWTCNVSSSTHNVFYEGDLRAP